MRRDPEAPMTVAVIMATGWDGGGPDPGPAAVLPCGGDPRRAAEAADEAPTLLTRLCEQLARLNVPDPVIVTRPEMAPALHKDGHFVLESPSPAADLREIARIARHADGPVLLLPGDVVVGAELLRRLLLDGDDAPVTAVTVPRGDGYGTVPVRRYDGWIMSAGSPYHRVTAPDAASPGVLRVAADRTDDLAALAGRLADLLRDARALPLTVVEPEAAHLLLVGLVRTGVPVRDCGDPRLPCPRAGSADAAVAAREAVEKADEERVRLAAAVKRDDGLFATYAVGSYSPHLVRWAARRGLTPITVTWMSLGLAVLAAVWFAAGTRGGVVTGAALLYAAFVLDCVDGQLARFTRRRSALGAWLDVLLDRVKEYGVYAGLAVGAIAAGHGSGAVWGLAVAAMTLQTVRHTLDHSFASRPAGPGRRPLPQRTAPLTAPDDGPIERRPAPSRKALRWARKVVALPVGERIALIAVTAALFDARVTFVALLAWGGLALAHRLATRVLTGRRRKVIVR
ncbi:CDP-alcohol phosphatidyltransferase family protein [Actinomadura miaoliensis]|uniref:CDP-alcohol phosphatidyltransferase family protein n=1 Tax=Actinomadura miaoliensis TaxID=430685 RepID=UPI0031EC3723